MKNLKQILSKEDVKENIKNNLFLSNEEMETAINTVLNSDENNNFSTKVIRNGKTAQFENALHEDTNKMLYLLESRLFDENNQMVNSYLEIFDYEGNIINEYVDDVWTYADWKIVQ